MDRATISLLTSNTSSPNTHHAAAILIFLHPRLSVSSVSIVADLTPLVSRWSNCFHSEKLYHSINPADLASFATDDRRSPVVRRRPLHRHLIIDHPALDHLNPPPTITEVLTDSVELIPHPALHLDAVASNFRGHNVVPAASHHPIVESLPR
jgi:hypothetical protein